MIDLGTQVITETLGYIDPGTGSLIIQFLIAGGLSGVVLLKIYWNKIFKKKEKKEDKDEDKG